MARRNLSRLLPQLRMALPEPAALRISKDAIALDRESVVSDTVLFQRLLTQVEGEPRVDDLARAIDFYRGPFLDGFSLPGAAEFEVWASLERERWQELYLRALATLIDEHAARDHLSEAIRCAERYLETDDLAETVHRRLIELYTAYGDRGAALRQYERCVTVLERELGVSPLPQTQAVYQAILSGEPVAELPSSREPAPPILPELDVPFVGRARVLQELRAAYLKARSGHGQIVLMSGEAGIGKSRLIREFAQRMSGDCLVLSGAGHPFTRSIPYQPIVQALRDQLEVGKGDRLPPSVWLSEVYRLLPELGILYPDLPSPADLQPQETQGRLFEALRQFIIAHTKTWRVVLLYLDDLHWADTVTLDWLAYLGQRIVNSRLMVIGAYRSDEADALALLRRSLGRQGILTEIELAGLDAEAVREIVRQQTHTRPSLRADEGLAARLHERTGGNPFFLLETVRVLIESGRVSREPGGEGGLPLPDTVRAAVRARLEQLSPVARQVLEAGSALGPRFDFDVVRVTAGRRELETMDGLDELVARQLLLEHPDGYQFRHEIVREAVNRGLSLWRRRLLQRRAADAIERS
jgi:DNA-binding SARP family transcriptional activator